MVRICFLGLMLIIVVLSLVMSGGIADAQNQQFDSSDNTNPSWITPEFIAQIGGPTYAVARQGNYAYAGVGPRLFVLDVSSPAQPKFTGRTEVLSDVIYDVAVSGSYAYVNEGYGLRVIDISNPQAPKALGFYTMPDGGMGLEVVGSYAYVAAGRSGLRIIDISNPSAPFEVWPSGGPSSIQVGDPYVYAKDVAVLGNYAYVTYHYETHDWLEIYDIVNPVVPETEGSVDIPGYLDGVAVSGNYALVASYGSGLHIINISNPALPVEIGFVGIIGASEVVTIGNYAYVSGEHRFTIVNISDPTNPTSAGAYDGQGQNQGLAVAGNYAYLGNDLTGLVIINVSNPAAPVKAGSYNTPLPGFAVRIISVGKYLFIADRGMRIIDISNPLAPIEIGFDDTGASVWGLSIFGKYAYIAEGEDGLHIIDVSDPASLKEAAFYNPPYPVDNVEAIVGDYAYINDGFGGIYIVDILDLSRPIQIGFYDFYGYISKASVVGNYLYAAVWGSAKSGLRILDVSDPANPVETGFYNTLGGGYGIEVVDKYAYLAAGLLLHILDISNPSAPVQVGSCGLPGDPSVDSVMVVGNYAYSIGNLKGVYVIDITNPTDPVTVGWYDYPNWFIYDLVAIGKYVYVAAGYYGLVIPRLQTDKVVGSIPTSGGSLLSTDGNTNLIFPSGAFTQTVDVTYRQLIFQEHSSYWALVDHVFDISAMNSETGQAASLAPGQTFTMTYTYSDSEIGSAFEDTLGLFSWNGITWEREPSSTIDMVNNIITGTPDHLSQWAIMGDTNRFFMPLVGK